MHAKSDSTRRNLRAIWLGYLVLHLLLIGYLGVRLATMPQDNEALLPAVSLAGPIVTVAGIGLGFFARNQSYKKHWSGRSVSKEGYEAGNLVGWTLLLMATLVNILLIGVTLHALLPSLCAIPAFIAHLLTFPTGRPMQPAEPRIEPHS
jgi:hypothetical protein